MLGKFLRRIILFFSLVIIILSSYFGYIYWRTHRYDSLIKQVAAVYKLDQQLVKAVIYEESYFDPSARSSAGAVGLMQITPIVVTEWKIVEHPNEQQSFIKEWAHRVDGVPYNQAIKLSEQDLLSIPEINIHIGCWYLDYLRRRYIGDPQVLPMMLAGYNAGPSQAERWRKMIDPQSRSTNKYIEQIDFSETRNYVRRILTRYRKEIK